MLIYLCFKFIVQKKNNSYLKRQTHTMEMHYRCAVHYSTLYGSVYSLKWFMLFRTMRNRLIRKQSCSMAGRILFVYSFLRKFKCIYMLQCQQNCFTFLRCFCKTFSKQIIIFFNLCSIESSLWNCKIVYTFLMNWSSE